MENKPGPAPLISLITPTYQAGRFIREYLDSVLQQTWTDFELLLVNDGSTDNSETIINSLAPEFAARGIALRYLRQEHQGQAAAFNLALPLLRGQLLAWADSDDILHPDNLRLRVEYMLAHPECRLLRCNAVHYAWEGSWENSRLLGEVAKPGDKQTQFIFDRLFRSRTYCLAGCYMLRTDLFLECWPQARIPLSDVGQNLQMLLPAASRAECHYLDFPLLCYRRRADGHFRSNRTPEKLLRRTRALTVLLKELLPRCACEQKSYAALADKMEKLGISALCNSLGRTSRAGKDQANKMARRAGAANPNNFPARS